jgi:stage IV sporulation protein FB
VFLLEPDRTQFDLNWRMGRIPVRVHPMFWVVTIILGFEELHDGFQFLLLWVAVVFVSILIHELGHVLMGRVFGTDGHIVLYSFGGLAVGSNGMSNRWQRMAVSFAGPLADFLLVGVLFLVLRLFLPAYFRAAVDYLLSFADRDQGIWRLYWTTLPGRAIDDLIWINLAWGLVNLLPIWPLDGGQISRDFITWATPRNGVRASLGLSVVVAGLIALNAAWIYFKKEPLIPHFLLGGGYVALFFGLLAVQSFLTLQQLSKGQGQRWQRREEEENRLPWERDPDYWKSGRRDPWE